jgi:hypothetical protein
MDDLRLKARRQERYIYDGHWLRLRAVACGCDFKIGYLRHFNLLHSNLHFQVEQLLDTYQPKANKASRL